LRHDSLLFSPTRIAGMELRNRLVMSPMETCYATPEGLPSPQYVDYFVARARGGVGLITLGACTIDEHHREVPTSIQFGNDEVISAHRELVDQIHAHGARVQPQLVHPGPDGLAPFMSGEDNIGPSIIASYLTGTPCRELAVDELPAIVDRYRQAARRVREAGYDGIELHAAHGYMLLGSFLTPWRNRRTDAYRGDRQEGRIRLIVEVAEAIKREVGAEFPLTLRLSGYERVPDGRSLHDSQEIAPRLVDAGVDAFHVSGGVIDRLTTQMVTGSSYGEAHNVFAAAAIKRVVDVPVMTVGRIHDPELAESILARGDADLIVMGRPLLADPELPEKARTGRVREIRRCISCESCIDSMEQMRMRCAVNPFTGRESTLVAKRATSARHVMVVGGGPGGMEAARVAALRGHRVTLYERSRLLGGALVAAATVHTDNEPLLQYLTSEIARLGVDVRTGTEVNAAILRDARPDAVVVATGGQLVLPDIAGSELPHVLSGRDLRATLSGRPGDLSHGRPGLIRAAARLSSSATGALITPRRVRSLARLWLPVGLRVVVVGADLAAIELSEFFAEHGRRVSIVDHARAVAPEVGAKRRAEHMDRLSRLDVVVNTNVRVERIERDAVIIRHTSRSESRVAADSVVIAGTVEADTRLADIARELVDEVHTVGDCTGLGLIRGAVEEGAKAGCAL